MFAIHFLFLPISSPTCYQLWTFSSVNWQSRKRSSEYILLTRTIKNDAETNTILNACTYPYIRAEWWRGKTRSGTGETPTGRYVDLTCVNVEKWGAERDGQKEGREEQGWKIKVKETVALNNACTVEGFA